VELIQIYECFCDRTRLRMLHLLAQAPLCVCHFQSLLDESQVKISKHLAYLKAKKVVVAKRHQNWMIYSLPDRRPVELERNLRCLQDCVQTDPVFRADLRKLRAMGPEVQWIAACCGPVKTASAPKASGRERRAKPCC
jgi:ArsR family transcriptional regulator